jgi:hypothetical protein
MGEQYSQHGPDGPEYKWSDSFLEDAQDVRDPAKLEAARKNAEGKLVRVSAAGDGIPKSEVLTDEARETMKRFNKDDAAYAEKKAMEILEAKTLVSELINTLIPNFF